MPRSPWSSTPSENSFRTGSAARLVTRCGMHCALLLALKQILLSQYPKSLVHFIGSAACGLFQSGLQLSEINDVVMQIRTLPCGTSSIGNWQHRNCCSATHNDLPLQLCCEGDVAVCSSGTLAWEQRTSLLKAVSSCPRSCWCATVPSVSLVGHAVPAHAHSQRHTHSGPCCCPAVSPPQLSSAKGAAGCMCC